MLYLFLLVSLQSSNDESCSILQKVVAMLGELLSRPKLNLKDSHLIDYPEIGALNAIVEIKVETAIINENINKDVYLLIIFIGIILLIISSIVYTICLWYSNHPICSRQSEIDLSVTDTTRCHEEEKSNNLQNEENFRRYANPLKNSTCSLRSSSNVELNPIHDLAGPSGLNRSQLSMYKSPKDFTNDFNDTTTTSVAAAAAISKTNQFNSQQQSMYLKTQNFDVDKNTIESQQMNKDFDKRLNKIDFKCFSPPSVASISPTTTKTMAISTTLTTQQKQQQQQHQHQQQQPYIFNSSSSNTINNSNDTLTLHI